MMYRKPRILWLSDIHYRISKSKNSKSKKDYFDSIVNYLKDEEVTHIIISGDLSFSGKKNQFKQLWSNFIKKLTKNKPLPKIISIPGNHDLDRTLIAKDITYKNYVGRNCEANRQCVSKDDDSFTHIKNLFCNYSDFFTEYLKDYEGNSGLNYLLDVDKTKGLFNIIIDREYNLNFICLNSAWFAWGADEFGKMQKFESLLRKKAINLDDFLGSVDYGNLVLPELNDIFNYIEKNKQIVSENLNIGIIHHPFSWLSWNTNYVESFSNIIDKLDIILSSHVHVPHFKPSIYRGKTLVLESPQIWDYHLENKPYGDIKWSKIFMGFSILNIDLNKNKLIHSNYITKQIRLKTDETGFELFIKKSNKTWQSKFLRKIFIKSSLLDKNFRIESKNNGNLTPIEYLKETYYFNKVDGKNIDFTKLINNFIEKRLSGSLTDYNHNGLPNHKLLKNDHDLFIVFSNEELNNEEFKKGFDIINVEGINNFKFIFFDFQVCQIIKEMNQCQSNHRRNFNSFDNLFLSGKVNKIQDLREARTFDEKKFISYSIIDFYEYEEFLNYIIKNPNI